MTLKNVLEKKKYEISHYNQMLKMAVVMLKVPIHNNSITKKAIEQEILDIQTKLLQVKGTYN